MAVSAAKFQSVTGFQDPVTAEAACKEPLGGMLEHDLYYNRLKIEERATREKRQKNISLISLELREYFCTLFVQPTGYCGLFSHCRRTEIQQLT